METEIKYLDYPGLQEVVTNVKTCDTEIKKIISNEQGTLDGLNTTDKSNIVAAINEVAGLVPSITACTDDEIKEMFS